MGLGTGDAQRRKRALGGEGAFWKERQTKAKALKPQNVNYDQRQVVQVSEGI